MVRKHEKYAYYSANDLLAMLLVSFCCNVDNESVKRAFSYSNVLRCRDWFIISSHINLVANIFLVPSSDDYRLYHTVTTPHVNSLIYCNVLLQGQILMSFL